MAELLRGLTDLGLKVGEKDEEFTLSSGEKTSYYVDAKRVVLTAPFAAIVGRLILQEMHRLGVSAVAGLTIGADPIASAAVTSAGDEEIRAFLVRKQKKEHGLSRWIEGRTEGVDRVLVVDDVVTLGGSMIDAIAKLGEEGFSVAGALALVDREKGGREAVQAALGESASYASLFTIDDVYPDRPDRPG